MTLRKKIVTVFLTLGLMSVFAAGLTFWSTRAQDGERETLEAHLMASALLERIGATSHSLFRRQALMLFFANPASRVRFQEADESIRADLETWTGLIDTDSGRAAHAAVFEAYDELARQLEAFRGLTDAPRDDQRLEDASEWLGGSAEWLDALRARDRDEDEAGVVAVESLLENTERLLEAIREGDTLRRFREAHRDAQELTIQRQKAVRERIADLRETILLAVNITAFATLCLVLLLSAYLFSDVFRPLQSLEDALAQLAQGRLDQRLPIDRDDELGRVGRRFNEAMDALSLGIGGVQGQGGGSQRKEAADGPLATYLGGVRDALAAGASDEALHKVETLLAELGGLARIHPIARVEIDPAGLMHEVSAQVQHVVAAARVGTALRVDGQLPRVLGDALRLRELFLSVYHQLIALVGFEGALEATMAKGVDPASGRAFVEVVWVRHRERDPVELSWEEVSSGQDVARAQLLAAHDGSYRRENRTVDGETQSERIALRLPVLS